jgi:aspartate kinase
MARIVQKYGGTSVADIDRIKAVAQRVKRAVDAGDEVAVVVSAMSGTTNQLVEWTRAVSPMHDAREYDVVVSAGEQITVGLMAMALQDIGVDARSWLGWQISDGDGRYAQPGPYTGCQSGRNRAPAGAWPGCGHGGFSGYRIG